MKSKRSVGLLARCARSLPNLSGYVDAPALHPVAEAVGDARIVMLGEQNHGDGAAFQAKIHLVRYLHEHLGFDVLAFEEDFFSIHRAWEGIRLSGDVQRGLRGSVYAFWRDASVMKSLWSFIEARSITDRPLIVAGFDPRFSGTIAREMLLNDLLVFLSQTGVVVEIMDDLPAFRQILKDMLELEYEHKVSALDRKLFFDTLWLLRAYLADETSDEGRFWQQQLVNLEAAARNAWGLRPETERWVRTSCGSPKNDSPTRRSSCGPTTTTLFGMRA